MFEPTIKCKTCGTENPLTETLARPFIEAERKKIDQETRERAAAFEKREKKIQQRTEQLSELQQDLRNQSADIEKAVQERLRQERAAIQAAAIETAERDFRLQLEQAREQGEIQSAKIAELENAELEYRTKRVALDEEKRQLELHLARRLDDEREKIRVEVTAEQRENFQLESEAKDRALSDLNAKLFQAQQAELTLREERRVLESQKQAFELDVTRRIDVERETIRAQVIEEQQKRFELESLAKDRALAEVNAKLMEAQQAEVSVRKARQELEAEKQALELDVARRLDEERSVIREATRKEDDEQNRFKLAEKEKVIDDMRKQIDELRRKSEQGSQQIQGEVPELELEDALRRAFPKDEINPVAVGRGGGDVLQKVVGPNGLECGSILWESKRTKGWNDHWLAKNRDDQRAVGAHLGVIVSTTLPAGVAGFDRKDGVWVTGFPLALALGRTLRQLIIESALARVSGEDREGKSNRVYVYVTGQEFRQRVGGILDAYKAMREEIETEKRTHKTRWAKQERSLDLLLDGTARLVGDLQGIVGKAMANIEGLDDHEIEATADQPPALEEGTQPPENASALAVGT
jgi:hypothetical protein